MRNWKVYKNSYYLYEKSTWQEVLELQWDVLICRDYGILESNEIRNFDEYIDALEESCEE